MKIFFIYFSILLLLFFSCDDLGNPKFNKINTGEVGNAITTGAIHYLALFPDSPEFDDDHDDYSEKEAEFLLIEKSKNLFELIHYKENSNTKCNNLPLISVAIMKNEQMIKVSYFYYKNLDCSSEKNITHFPHAIYSGLVNYNYGCSNLDINNNPLNCFEDDENYIYAGVYIDKQFNNYYLEDMINMNNRDTIDNFKLNLKARKK
jgi:hypothetical protein